MLLKNEHIPLYPLNENLAQFKDSYFFMIVIFSLAVIGCLKDVGKFISSILAGSKNLFIVLYIL